MEDKLWVNWLDSQKGKELHRFFASDKEGTLENRIASIYKKELKIHQKQLETKSGWNKSVEYVPLGDYWFRTC